MDLCIALLNVYLTQKNRLLNLYCLFVFLGHEHFYKF